MAFACFYKIDEHNEDGDYGILVMATDGLWDVSDNEIVSRTVFQTLHKYSEERHRYTMAAQELVARARGKINDYGHWRLADSKAAATVDDISVIVIPVHQYYKKHIEWEQRCAREHKERLVLEATEATEVENVLSRTTLTNGAGGSSSTLFINNTMNNHREDKKEATKISLGSKYDVPIGQEAVSANTIKTNSSSVGIEDQTKGNGKVETSEPDLIPKSSTLDVNNEATNAQQAISGTIRIDFLLTSRNKYK